MKTFKRPIVTASIATLSILIASCSSNSNSVENEVGQVENPYSSVSSTTPNTSIDASKTTESIVSKEITDSTNNSNTTTLNQTSSTEENSSETSKSVDEDLNPSDFLFTSLNNTLDLERAQLTITSSGSEKIEISMKDGFCHTQENVDGINLDMKFDDKKVGVNFVLIDDNFIEFVTEGKYKSNFKSNFQTFASKIDSFKGKWVQFGDDDFSKYFVDKTCNLKTIFDQTGVEKFPKFEKTVDNDIVVIKGDNQGRTVTFNIDKDSNILKSFLSSSSSGVITDAQLTYDDAEISESVAVPSGDDVVNPYYL